MLMKNGGRKRGGGDSLYRVVSQGRKLVLHATVLLVYSSIVLYLFKRSPFDPRQERNNREPGYGFYLI